MAKSGSEKIATLMSKRLMFSQKKLNEIIHEGESYWRYVFGTAPLAHGMSLDDVKSDPNFNPDEMAIADEADITVAPLDGILRDVMSPYLLSGNPIWVNKQRPRATPLELTRLKMFEELMEIIWDESEGLEEFRSMVDDAFFYRVGWAEVDFDDEKTLPRLQWADARDVLVDCEVRSCKSRDQRWRARKLIMPIETADYLAREKWDAKKYEFQPVPYQQDEIRSKRTAPGSGNVEDGELGEAPTDFVRLMRVFVRGKNPWTSTANQKVKALNDPAGHDDVYNGKDHVLILEATAGYQNWSSYKLVARLPYPFVCDAGDDPLTPVVVTRDNRSFYPYSRFQPSHSAGVATNMAIRAHNADMKLSSRRIIGYILEHFANIKEFEAAVYGNKQVTTAQMKAGGSVDQSLQVKNMGTPNASLEQGRVVNHGLFDLISGLAAFARDGKSHETALGASISNEDSQVRLGDTAGLVVGAIRKVAKKCLMCARTNMTNDDVARWMNMPTEVEGKEIERAMFLKDGGKELINDLWPNKPNPQDIRDEVEINLEPRSVRFSNPDKEKQNLFDLFKFQMELLRVIQEAANGGNPEVAKAIAVAGNATIELIAKTQNIANYQKCLIDLTKIVAPQPPAPTPPNEAEMMSAQAQQMQAMQGGINPQQKAAVSRVKQAGVEPSTLPAAVQ